jgi:hypothetical protein
LAVGIEEELAEEAAELQQDAAGTMSAAAPTPLAASSAVTARRVVSSLSSLSGADGRLYIEYSTAPQGDVGQGKNKCMVSMTTSLRNSSSLGQLPPAAASP